MDASSEMLPDCIIRKHADSCFKWLLNCHMNIQVSSALCRSCRKHEAVLYVTKSVLAASFLCLILLYQTLMSRNLRVSHSVESPQSCHTDSEKIVVTQTFGVTSRKLFRNWTGICTLYSRPTTLQAFTP